MSRSSIVRPLAFAAALCVAAASLPAAAESAPPSRKPRIHHGADTQRAGNSRTETVAGSPRPARMTECDRAQAGDSAAAYRLARRYLFGVGVERDQRTGAGWLRIAARGGNDEARRLVKYIPRQIGRTTPGCRPGVAFRAPPAEVVALVNKLAPDYRLDPKLVLAVIQVESGYRSDAVSPKDAAGLMQLIPETAERFEVDDVFDPADNVRGGMRYLRWLLSYYRGDVTLALAAYNAGEGAVDRHRGVPPYRETVNYVSLVRRFYAEDRHAFDDAVASASPILAGGSAGPGPSVVRLPDPG